MPVDCLPDNPDLERLKAHAKTLRDLVRAGIDGSIDLVREHHPRLSDLTAATPAATAFKLADAQLTLARHYDFASWAKLRDYVLLVNRLSRSPHKEPVGGPLADDVACADELLRLACLTFGADHSDRRAQADRMLVEHPHLAGWSVYTAAATGTVETMRFLLANDPTAAEREGGPFAWPPLLYLTFSRLAPRPGSDPVTSARLLLAAGADPNTGYLWDGLPSPFTALTGVFGRGEQGAPPHPNEIPLARLLLEAGAQANDSQTIYNRGLGDFANDDTEFLELLLDHGLGRGDGGPCGDCSPRPIRAQQRSSPRRSNTPPRPDSNNASGCYSPVASIRTALALTPASRGRAVRGGRTARQSGDRQVARRWRSRHCHTRPLDGVRRLLPRRRPRNRRGRYREGSATAPLGPRATQRSGRSGRRARPKRRCPATRRTRVRYQHPSSHDGITRSRRTRRPPTHQAARRSRRRPRHR